MSKELNTIEAKIFEGPMTIISSAAQGKGKRKSKQWTLGGLYFANIERYSALLVNVRTIFVTIFVDRPMLVKQNSTFSEMSVSFFGTVRRPFTKLGLSQETSRDLRHSSLTSLRLSRRCHLSWTNTVSWGNNPADFKVVLKSKDVSFLLGKLVTSSNRSFGYPSFWTIRTRSCQTENKIFNERMYFFRSLCEKTASFVKYMQECFSIKMFVAEGRLNYSSYLGWEQFSSIRTSC